MGIERTYLDSCLLIAAFMGKGKVGQRAMEILDNPERHFVVSDAVRLEVMPKPLHDKRMEESAFYEAVFQSSENVPWHLEALSNAQTLAEQYGLSAMDAIHIALALHAEADVFATGESPTKPMFRVKELSLISISESRLRPG
jgi:predicted nucleic acid-binding protein